jgi:hypothetical protein
MHPFKTTVGPSESAMHPSKTTVSPSESAMHPFKTTVGPSESAMHPFKTTVGPSKLHLCPYRKNGRKASECRDYAKPRFFCVFSSLQQLRSLLCRHSVLFFVATLFSSLQQLCFLLCSNSVRRDLHLMGSLGLDSLVHSLWLALCWFTP